MCVCGGGGGGQPGLWDIVDHTVEQEREVCVHQGVRYICQLFQKYAEKLGVFHPPHCQDQVDVDDVSFIHW